MEKEFVECRESVERLKDIISKDINGKVFDWHIADVLNIPYSTLRVNLLKNRMPIKQIAIYCYKEDIQINSIIF